MTSLFYVNIFLANSFIQPITEAENYQEKWEIINVDGDLSLSPTEDAMYWNHHSFRFDEGVRWEVKFSDEAQVCLRTSWGDSGHVATGMWWTRGFKGERKIPIYQMEIQVEFDIFIEELRYEEPGEWLRVALACAVERSDGGVVYTELDIFDSPHTQRHENGDITAGGDIVYRGGDVVEYKIDEIPLKTWRHYSLNLTRWIDRSWKIREGDLLESVYIVIEADKNPVEVELRIDNLWIFASALKIT